MPIMQAPIISSDKLKINCLQPEAQVDSIRSIRKRRKRPTTFQGPLRRSARLKKNLESKPETAETFENTSRQTGSQPLDRSTSPLGRKLKSKRKLSVGDPGVDSTSKSVCVLEDTPEPDPPDQSQDPILCWVLTGNWPEDFFKPAVTMDDLEHNDAERRKLGQVHRSDGRRLLARNGVFLNKSPHISDKSEKFCDELLEENHPVVFCVGYPESTVMSVLNRVLMLNESRIQRDVMPRIVPPAELLRFHGEPDLSMICEDLNAMWYRCEAKGGTMPKPDYTAGLTPEAFNAEETRKLENFACPQRPFLFTANVCFPFLTCEAKSGNQAMSRAQLQNIHNASIAVNAIIQLYQAAFGETEPQRVEELYGNVLAFSVSHDHDLVRIWGHYAIMQDGLKFYYHEIDAFLLSARNGRDKNRGYYFTRNVYTTFVPQHLERIKAAVKVLRDPCPPGTTRVSLSPSMSAWPCSFSSESSEAMLS